MKLNSLKRNVGYAAISHLINIIFPLLIVFCFARVLGLDAYGKYVWINTTMSLGIILVEFGFGWTSTNKLSANRTDRLLISSITINTWAVQLILFFVFSIGVILYAYIIDGININCYMIGLGIVFGNMLGSTWFFSGLEFFRPLAVFQFIGKALVIPLVISNVNSSNDLIYAIGLVSISSLIVGVFSFVWILNKFQIHCEQLNPSIVWQLFCESSILFASRAVITLYTTLVPMMVGSIAGDSQLALYNIADKCKSALQTLTAPVLQSVFPRISWLLSKDRKAAVNLIRTIAFCLVLVTISGGVLLMIYSKLFSALLGGPQFVNSSMALRWLSFVPLITALSNLMGLQIMIPLGMNKLLTLIVSSGAIINMVTIRPLIKLSGAVGAAQSVLLTETAIALMMFIALSARKKSSIYFRI